MGYEQIKAAQIYYGRTMEFTTLPHHGSVVTDSLTADEPTDSAAASTALATGHKVENAVINYFGDGERYVTILEEAKARGMRTGILTSDVITAATPAGFSASCPSRAEALEIAQSQISGVVDLLLGTEKVYDDQNVFATTYSALSQEKGFSLLTEKSQLSTVGEETDRLIGAFPDVVAEEYAENYPKCPTLEELVAFALDFLDNENGFFLMVESAKIDYCNHVNNLIPTLLELNALDQAFQCAMAWAAGREDTLIVVTADHESGGLAVGEGATKENLKTSCTYSTLLHTDAEVGYWANLPSEYWKPVIDNTDIFRAMQAYLPENSGTLDDLNSGFPGDEIVKARKEMTKSEGDGNDA